MAHGANTGFNVVIASGVTTSTEVNLGRAWRRVYFDPTGALAECRFQAAPTVVGTLGPVSGTYRLVQWPATNSGTAGTAIVGSGLSGSLIETPLSGFQFVKVLLSAAAGANTAITLKVHCSDQ